MIALQASVSVPLDIRGYTVRISVKVAPTVKTAPWSAPVRTLLTVHRLMGPAFAKRAGEDRPVPPPALREPGARDATPPATAPTEQNVTQWMDPAPAPPAGRGRAVISHVQWVRLGQAA